MQHLRSAKRLHPAAGSVLLGSVLALVIAGCSGTSTPSQPAPSVAPSAPASASASTPWTGAAVTTTPMSATDAAVVDAFAKAALASAPDLPGMWIGVWDPAKGFYTQAYGDAVEGGAKATLDDHGRIGSVTKTFTVTAVLQQVAAGKLSLDSTIDQVLPDLAAKYPEIGAITVDQLAGMRSGIPDYANTGVVIKGVVDDPAEVWTADALIDAAMTLPLAPAGTGGYSTTNTIILGKMLEKITGKTIEQVVNDVAAQAGMTQSELQAADVVKMPDPASHGYVAAAGAAELSKLGSPVKAGTDVTDWTVSWGQAGGGMYSTVADLGKWAATGLGTALLPADLGAKRLTTSKIPEGNMGYGIFDWGNGWVGHTGQLLGWESLVAYNTKTGAAFTTIVNETGSLLAAERVALQVFPDLKGLVGF